MKITLPLSPLSPAPFQAQPLMPGASDSDASNADIVDLHSSHPTFTVEISSDGKKKAEEDKYADIDKAALPDDVKQALKNIRKLQERMAEKQREIQEIMQDDSLSDETKKSRRQAALGELKIMESAMSDAQNALSTRMSSHNLDAKDRALAKGLVGMK